MLGQVVLDWYISCAEMRLLPFSKKLIKHCVLSRVADEISIKLIFLLVIHRKDTLWTSEGVLTATICILVFRELFNADRAGAFDTWSQTCLGSDHWGVVSAGRPSGHISLFNQAGYVYLLDPTSLLRALGLGDIDTFKGYVSDRDSLKTLLLGLVWLGYGEVYIPTQMLVGLNIFLMCMHGSRINIPRGNARHIQLNLVILHAKCHRLSL